jgi:3-deoxy-D-manno-octulosonate 8-phosphate phosphatase (KDO 8-P phosphatase)
MMPGKSPIKAIALDVDGVLTDGSFWWGPDGQEWKRFNFRDIMGISLAQKAGIMFALISGENSPLVDRFATKMNITAVFKGCKDKGSALKEFASQNGLALAAIAFMGDDVNDLGAMKLAGLSAAPANAHPSVLEQAAFVAKGSGGHGAVRELVDHLVQTGPHSSAPKRK